MVSIVIVNYNGLNNNYLPDCLHSIVQQTYPNIEVIVVDNASTDGSLTYLEQSHPHVIRISNTENVGFCRGNNIGYQKTSGEYIFFVNNDTILAPDCVSELVNIIQTHPNIGMLSPKIIRTTAQPTLDSAGLCLRPNLMLRDRGFSEPDTGQFDQPVYLFAVCGAACFYPRTVLEAVQHVDGSLWDEDFWAYYEDGDLAWRVQNYGLPCLYWPTAVVQHHRGGSSPSTFFQKPDLFKLHTIKNRYLMLIKNAHPNLLKKQWWPLLKQEVLIWGYLLLHPRLLRLLVNHLYHTIPKARQNRKQIHPKPINPFEIKPYESSTNS